MDWRAGASSMAVAVAIVAAQMLAATSQSVKESMKEVKGKKIPAVFTFGDSILDTGNNNVLPTMAKCNFPPYGKDFVDHQPTGRFSNGKNPSDLIASGLGIKELLPPYLTTTGDEELLTGVCFASGGTGYDPLTARSLGLLTMSDQLDLFREYKTRLASIAGSDRANWIVSNGLHVVTGGSNDLMGTFFTSHVRETRYNVSTYVGMLVTTATNFIQELYQLGARKIGIVGLPPIGCVPSQRTFAGGTQRSCVLPQNQAAVQYNVKLSSEIQRLKCKFYDAKITYIDIYSPLSDIIQRPSAYGFTEASKGCCGTGLLEASMLCNSLSTNTCRDRASYVFWDSVHPTQKTYEIIIKRVMEKYFPLLL